MKKYSRLLGFLSVFLGACVHSPVNNRSINNRTSADTLIYNYKNITASAPDCKGKGDSTCTQATLTYPFFQAQPLLNDSIKSKLISIFSFSDKRPSSLQQMADGVITAYQADTNAVNNHSSYTLDASVKVIRQDSSLLVLDIEGYSFAGGAHGSSQAIFVNWDTKRNRQVSLGDILQDGTQPDLTRVGEKIFRKDEKLSDTASLANDYFFKDGKFSLNDNFMVTPGGLEFLYNEYEIKSYAQGQTKLFIPYSQIKSLLRPNTVVSQYIK